MAIQNKQKICCKSIAEAGAFSSKKKEPQQNHFTFQNFSLHKLDLLKLQFFFYFIFISSQGIITSVHFCGEESGSPPPPPISIILTEIKEQSRDFFVDSLVKWGHFGYILSNGLLGVSFWSLSLSKHQLATFLAWTVGELDYS